MDQDFDALLRRDREGVMGVVELGHGAQDRWGPESDEYVFPGGLAPVTIDREADSGTYWEPNVWMRHRLAP